jgi:hypothetical protein
VEEVHGQHVRGLGPQRMVDAPTRWPSLSSSALTWPVTSASATPQGPHPDTRRRP